MGIWEEWAVDWRLCVAVAAPLSVESIELNGAAITFLFGGVESVVLNKLAEPNLNSEFRSRENDHNR